MIKNYLVYLWKKTYKFVIVAFFVFLLLYPVSLLANGTPELIRYYTILCIDGVYETVPTEYFYVSHYDTLLSRLTILAMASCYLLPIIVQATFQSKKRCDTLLALPIRKKTQILLTSAYAFVTFLILFWITALLGLGASVIVQQHYDVPNFFLYLLVMTVFSAGTFGITTLFASLMNNVVDSILMVILSMAIAPLFYLMIDDMPTTFDCSDMLLFTCPIYAADRVTCYFQEQVAYYSEGLLDLIASTPPEFARPEYIYNSFFYYTFGAKEIGGMFTLLGMGIVSYGASYFLWKGLRAEAMQTPSAKWYTYPLTLSVFFIPAFFLCRFIPNFETENLLIQAIFIVTYFIATFIFQRKIKFNKTNLIAFGATYLASTIPAFFLG
ncbi:MAG: hypothetical protein J5993_03030 [Clostridia bacterium]|nr:hypothetical protein [Clostridia bacterium]